MPAITRFSSVKLLYFYWCEVSTIWWKIRYMVTDVLVSTVISFNKSLFLLIDASNKLFIISGFVFQCFAFWALIANCANYVSVLSCHHFTLTLHKSLQLDSGMAGKNSPFENCVPACCPDTTRLKVIGEWSSHRPLGQGEKWDVPFCSFILPIPAGPAALETAERLPSPSSGRTFLLKGLLTKAQTKAVSTQQRS